MVEPKKKKIIRIPRSFLMVMLLTALSLGVLLDRGFILMSGSHPEERQDRYAYPGDRTSSRQDADKHSLLFRSQLEHLVRQELHSRSISSLSLYFLDFTTGDTFGIGEDVKFPPRSLLKLPLMIAYFKNAESNPEILNSRLSFHGGGLRRTEQKIKSPRPLETGKTYSIGDLIYRMVVFGDDDAFTLLSSRLPEGTLDRLYRELGMDIDPADEEDSMTLEDYASFYRVLYTASYLNRKMSDKALKYLSKATFRNGIVAGVPPNIPVASRFGEVHLPASGIDQRSASIQLHEIGIVYYPGRPYLLGVITRGSDFTAQSRVLRDISRFIYREIEHLPKEKAL